MNPLRSTLPFCLIAFVLAQFASGQTAAPPPPPNTWTAIAEDGVGPRVSPGLVWSAKQNRFVMIAGTISHAPKPPFPYDIVSFDPASRLWENDLPPGGEKWGERVGPVTPPKFKSPYFEMTDAEGNIRPWQRQAKIGYTGVRAPWDGLYYSLVCGRTLAYDIDRRAWKNLEPPQSPVPQLKTEKEGLNWSALCADPVNQELLLFGGCGAPTSRGDPGTWVYSTRDNRWRQLDLKTQPPQRALSPMVYDPATKKIVLFGGDALDALYADTWVYDCATRTWEERRPAVSPSPRFGHALLHLPKSGKIVLLGGIGYSSSTSYLAMLYQPHPFEIWTYDIAANTWSLIKQYEDKAGPTLFTVGPAVAAADEADRVLWWGPKVTGNSYEKNFRTWLATIDASTADSAGTTTHGVKPGTITHRTGSYDPAWYAADVPPPDAAKQQALYAKLPANRWTPVDAPKFPINRQGGGWSTVAYDTDRQQFLHLGGGHSSYFGNDVAMFDTNTARWSISCRPQVALDFNYDLTGPGPWAFNGGPWANHNYHAYGYDPVRKRLVYVRGPITHFFDPVRSNWREEERILDNPFNGIKYTTYVTTTPQGVVLWSLRTDSQSASGVWKLTPQGWSELKTTGEALPIAITDGATTTFDAPRNRLLITTTKGEKDIKHSGQIWAVDLNSGAVTKLNPAGQESITVQRFARESILLPKRNLVLFGYHLAGQNRIPIYDIANNRWTIANIPGSEFFSNKTEGASVDLGLQYDVARDLIWAVMCNLRPGAVQAMRVDEALKLDPL